MSSPSESTSGSTSGSRTGVIHDIGYRPYSGERLGEGRVAWALFVTGLRNCFGLGRSARSKALPMILLGLMLLPALILVGVLVQAKDLLGINDQIVAYSTYPLTVQLLISVFVASQAPVLVSRDLRFRSLTLYLARPLRRTTYVLVRLASLIVATFILIGAPLLLMYVGGLLADLPVGRESERIVEALVGALLLAGCLAGPAAVVAALTTRRGLAVAAIIVVLLVSFVVVSSIQGIGMDEGHETVAEVAGLFSPYTLVNEVQVFLFDSPAGTQAPPTGTGIGLLHLAMVAVVLLGSVGAMLWRYRKVEA
ncbi:ABC transporter permease [Nocardioides sp.]|uniref:ABC transporter permease n=1 Tax=Nocardioides sp. TaxID=35761 RepID=UPI002D8073D2|nr:ABC transporter permease [Nocardioides sp.]HET8960659.1 ABC transporter permease [Nocardioides sp.]